MPSRRAPFPVAGEQLARRAPKHAAAPPPVQLTLSHGRFHLPAGGEARLVPREDFPDTFNWERGRRPPAAG
jgi:hypothetical protein